MNPAVTLAVLAAFYAIGATVVGVVLIRKRLGLAERTGQRLRRSEARMLSWAVVFWPVGFFIASGAIQEEEEAQDRFESVVLKDTDTQSASDKKKANQPPEPTR